MVSNRTRRTFRGWVGGLLIMGTSVVGAFLPKLLTGEQSLFSMTSLGVLGAVIILTFLYARYQVRSGEESPEAIKEQVDQLHSELRSQVQSRSYGARSRLIAAPLKELQQIALLLTHAHP